MLRVLRSTLAGISCAGALALYPATALALSIDEFEDGALSTAVDLGVGGIAALGGARDIDVVIGSSDAELVLSPADDSIVLNGSVTIWYDGDADGSNAATLGTLNADLSAEGSRFLVDVSSLPAPNLIFVYAFDGTTGHGVSVGVSSPGQYEIPFSSFGAVDMSDIRTIGLFGRNLSISSFSVVPEPSTGMLLGMAFIGLFAAGRASRPYSRS